MIQGTRNRERGKRNAGFYLSTGRHSGRWLSFPKQQVSFLLPHPRRVALCAFASRWVPVDVDLWLLTPHKRTRETRRHALGRAGRQSHMGWPRAVHKDAAEQQLRRRVQLPRKHDAAPGLIAGVLQAVHRHGTRRHHDGGHAKRCVRCFTTCHRQDLQAAGEHLAQQPRVKQHVTPCEAGERTEDSGAVVFGEGVVAEDKGLDGSEHAAHDEKEHAKVGAKDGRADGRRRDRVHGEGRAAHHGQHGGACETARVS